MRNRGFLPGDINEIAKLLKRRTSTDEYRRIQCVYLAMRYPEMSAKQIGEITLFSENRVWIIHGKYRKYGIEGLKEKRGGRYHENLTFDEECKLLSSFVDESESGRLVVAGKIKLVYEAQVGKKVPESTVYRMLSRHGFRKIIPYQRHPKANKEEPSVF